MGSMTLSGNPSALLIQIHVPTPSVFRKSNGISKKEIFGMKLVVGQFYCGNESTSEIPAGSKDVFSI